MTTADGEAVGSSPKSRHRRQLSTIDPGSAIRLDLLAHAGELPAELGFRVCNIILQPIPDVDAQDARGIAAEPLDLLDPELMRDFDAGDHEIAQRRFPRTRRASGAFRGSLPLSRAPRE